MIAYSLILVCIALIVGLFALAVTVYARIKHVANGMLALGVKEFHDAVESMLKTPEDLPQGVLDAISAMNRTAFASGAHWRVRKLIELDRKGLIDRSDQGFVDLAKQVADMRPELRALFRKANEAWISIMCNRSILVGLMIAFEMARIQVDKGDISSSSVANSEAVKLLPGLCATS